MDAAKEQQVLQALYDRLWDAITYAPDNTKSPSFSPQTTLVQFSKGEALNPVDFNGAFSPVVPKGDLTKAEVFSALVDAEPAVQGVYADSGRKIAGTYTSIVTGANADQATPPAQQKLYDNAYGFLNTTTSVKDFNGNTVQQTQPSPIYQTYLDNMIAYNAALAAFRNAYNNYDMSDPQQQRAFQANAPLLQAAINKTWSTWRTQGAAQVEQAMTALDTTVNSGIRNALALARQTLANGAFTSALGTGTPWQLSYALPSNWADKSGLSNYSDLTLSSKNLNTSSSSSFTSFSAGAEWNAGLWSVDASTSHSQSSTKSHMDADEFTLNAKLAMVRINRPWYNDVLLRMEGWYTDAFDKNKVSSGSIEMGSPLAMPILPVAFFVVRDIQITANFSTEDKTHFEQKTQASASVGWGPFKISGTYGGGSSNDTFQSTFNGGTLKIPGMQIVAWVNTVVPACPPLSSKVKVGV